MQRICVFCGSRSGRLEQYIVAATELGRALAARRVGLVYGGASVGLMGAVADAVMSGGGHAIGVIPKALEEREVAHHALNELRVVGSMHERKAMMAELADAFVAMPGGGGTMEEFFEIFTWAQLGIHHKPFALYNIAGFYDPLLRFLDHATAEGFLPEEDRRRVVVASEPAELFRGLEAVVSRATPAVLKSDET